MDRDTVMYNLISSLMMECEDWKGFVDGIGNQCAFTDRKLEMIIDTAMALREEYLLNELA